MPRQSLIVILYYYINKNKRGREPKGEGGRRDRVAGGNRPTLVGGRLSLNEKLKLIIII